MTTMTTCSGCGAQIAPQNVLYTTAADPVCAKCYAKEDIVETDKRAAANIKRLAIGSAVGGVITFLSPLSGIGLVVIGCILFSMISGIWALQSMARGNERFTRHLTSGDRTLVWIASIFGIALSGLMGLAWMRVVPYFLSA